MRLPTGAHASATQFKEPLKQSSDTKDATKTGIRVPKVNRVESGPTQ